MKNDNNQEVVGNIEDLIQHGNKDAYILPQYSHNQKDKKIYNKTEKSLKHFHVQEDGSWKLVSVGANVTTDGSFIDKTSSYKFFNENGDISITTVVPDEMLDIGDISKENLSRKSTRRAVTFSAEGKKKSESFETWTYLNGEEERICSKEIGYYEDGIHVKFINEDNYSGKSNTEYYQDGKTIKNYTKTSDEGEVFIHNRPNNTLEVKEITEYQNRDLGISGFNNTFYYDDSGKNIIRAEYKKYPNTILVEKKEKGFDFYINGKKMTKEDLELKQEILRTLTKHDLGKTGHTNNNQSDNLDERRKTNKEKSVAHTQEWASKLVMSLKRNKFMG